jgi:hypothetical protein
MAGAGAQSISTTSPRARAITAICAVVVASIGVAWSGRVSADEPTPLEVELVAPRACGGASAFEQRVRARVHSRRPAPRPWKARVDIVLHDDLPRVTGTLALQAPTDARLVREVGGGDCSEVLDALALVTALALDNGDIVPSFADVVVPRVASASASASVSTSAPPRPAPSAPTSASVTPSLASSSARVTLVVASASPMSPAERSWRWNLGVHGGAMGVVAPTLAPHAGVFVEALAPTSWGALIRWTFQQARPATTHTADGDATFVATTLRTQGCPVSVPRSSAVSVSPCAGVEVGLLDAKGSNASDATSLLLFWFSGTLSGRVSAEISRSFVLVGEAGAIVPGRRDRFYFDPSGVTAHQPPAIGPWLSLGLGIRLP